MLVTETPWGKHGDLTKPLPSHHRLGLGIVIEPTPHRNEKKKKITRSDSIDIFKTLKILSMHLNNQLQFISKVLTKFSKATNAAFSYNIMMPA